MRVEEPPPTPTPAHSTVEIGSASGAPGSVVVQIAVTLHTDDWPLVHGSLERCVQAGEPMNVEYRVGVRDARVRWIASRGRLHVTSAGTPER